MDTIFKLFLDTNGKKQRVKKKEDTPAPIAIVNWPKGIKASKLKAKKKKKNKKEKYAQWILEDVLFKTAILV